MILKESLHLLLAFHEKRLDLRLLICGQVQLAGEAFQLAVRIHAHAAPTRSVGGRCGLVLIRWRGRGVLSESGAGAAEGKKAAKGHGEKSGLHIGYF